ncbi:hypothetical protein DASC09_063290 [Saccharomycopsis crataegensis]|uniref:Uncharacterized protein n=1 Tax=Saccharomycopsis crataegensis TaxID=43959 RepID=A0AAV5QXZ0_9ASCO|nr:hypothetical protein DASC09_063290 [Saccharomycopsis crataegensis]
MKNDDNNNNQKIQCDELTINKYILNKEEEEEEEEGGGEDLLTMDQESMVQQYYPVILEIGSRLIKAGFAGDAAPISTLQTNDPIMNFHIQKPSKTNGDQSLNMASISLNGASYALTAENHRSLSESILDPSIQLNATIDNFYKSDLIHKRWLFHDDFLLFQTLEPLQGSNTERLLEKIVSHIYNSDLLVDSKRCKVIIPVSIFLPDHIRRLIANVLLNYIHAQSLIFLPDSLLSILSAGTQNGLVVDLDWDMITISPVFDQKLLYKNIKTTTRGSGKQLHYAVLRQLLNNKQHVEGIDINNKNEVFHFIEDLIHEVVYCKNLNDSYGNGNGDNDDNNVFSYKNNIKIPNRLRFQALESEFFPQITPKEIDDDEIPLASLIIEVLDSLPIDIRPVLSKRIMFTGFLSDIPGLKSRIMHELRSAGNAKYEAIISLGSWTGASLYCSTKLMASSSIIKNQELVRDTYLETNKLIPGWIDQLYTLAQ